MAGLWEEYSSTASLVSAGATLALEIFHNEVDDHIFASAPITIVDGIVTIGTNILADLVNVKLGVFPELYIAADVEATPPHDPNWWYRWFVTGGPLVFRLRSKRTIPSEHKLWIRFTKALGSTTVVTVVGMEFFMVRHQ